MVFRDENGDTAGGLRIRFGEKPIFTFLKCLHYKGDVDYSCFEDDGDKTIVIIKDGYNMKVSYQFNMLIVLI